MFIGEIEIKHKKSLKSTQIAIEIIRTKIELNTSWRTQLNFGRFNVNPKVRRERKKERRKKINCRTIVIKPGPRVDPAKGPGPGFHGSTRVNSGQPGKNKNKIKF
jgi:hypothetical protein